MVLKDAVVILSGVKWFPLGIQLDIKKSELDRIKTENPQNENNCMIEVLHYWLKNTLSGCTWDKLANAVERMGGESKVVESLRARQELNGMSSQLYLHKLLVFIIQSCSSIRLYDEVTGVM